MSDGGPGLLVGYIDYDSTLCRVHLLLQDYHLVQDYWWGVAICYRTIISVLD